MGKQEIGNTCLARHDDDSELPEYLVPINLFKERG